jgi:hypothetical protein
VVRVIASVAAEEVVGLIDLAVAAMPGASAAVVGLGDDDSRTKKVSGFWFRVLAGSDKCR